MQYHNWPLGYAGSRGWVMLSHTYDTSAQHMLDLFHLCLFYHRALKNRIYSFTKAEQILAHLNWQQMSLLSLFLLKTCEQNIIHRKQVVSSSSCRDYRLGLMSITTGFKGDDNRDHVVYIWHRWASCSQINLQQTPLCVSESHCLWNTTTNMSGDREKKRQTVRHSDQNWILGKKFNIPFLGSPLFSVREN